MIPSWEESSGTADAAWYGDIRARGSRRTLAADNLWALDASSGVARINHELRLPHDALVVVIGVVGHDQHTVVLRKIFQRGALHPQVVFAPFANGWEVGIVVADLCALLLQQFDNGQGWRLAQIIDVLLIYQS